MARRALFGTAIAFLFVVVLSAVVTATAAADYRHFGEQQFSAAASHFRWRWGFRACW